VSLVPERSLRRLIRDLRGGLRGHRLATRGSRAAREPRQGWRQAHPSGSHHRCWWSRSWWGLLGGDDACMVRFGARAGRRSDLTDAAPSVACARASAVEDAIGEVVCVVAAPAEVDHVAPHRRVLQGLCDPLRSPAAGGVAIHHDGHAAAREESCPRWRPGGGAGTAMAAMPHDRAAIMSGGPSRRTMCREVSAAGCGISPSLVPRVEEPSACPDHPTEADVITQVSGGIAVHPGAWE
jgi:hypothetical protein